MFRPFWAGIVLAAGVLLAAGEARAQDGDGVHWVLPAGQEDMALGLVSPYVTLAPVEPGTWFERIALTASGMDFVILGKSPPAGPVTIKLRWSEFTPSAAIPPSLDLSIHGLDEGTPENLARSIEILHELIDERVGNTLGAAFSSTEAADGAATSFLKPMRAEEYVDQGVAQIRWSEVAATAPGSLPWWSYVLCGAAALVFGALGVHRRRQGRPAWVAGWGLLVPLIIVAVWWMTGDADLSPELDEEALEPEVLEYLTVVHRDFAAASLFVGAALLGLLGAVVGRVRQGARVRGARWFHDSDTAVLLLLAVGSLLLRFGVGGMDLLTDGGSGFERVLRYGFGYGGWSLVVGWFLPASLEGLIWPGIAFTSLASAMAPVALYGVARELEFTRPAAATAALALLCWPLHAAMYTSDFLQGPILTFGLLGLWCVTWGARKGRPGGLLAGTMVFGGLIWMRPDALVWALPFAAAAVPILRHPSSSSPVLLAVTYGILALSCRLFSYSQSPGIMPEGGGNVLVVNLEGFLLAGHAALPWWLWLGIPAGVPALSSRHRTAGLVAAGSVAAYLSLKVGGTPPDLLEFFRYLTPGMAWASLVVGLGLAGLVSLAPEGRARRAAAGVVALALLATPLVHARYLGTSYAPRVSDGIFREALAKLPDNAVVIVPGEIRFDGLDPLPRFRFIAWEVHRSDPERIPGDRVVSAALLLGFTEAEGRLPGPGELDRLESDSRGIGPIEWYYFKAGECLYTQGFDPANADDPGNCRGLQESLYLEPVTTWPAPYLNHRLVTQSRDRSPPKNAPDFEYVLNRVHGYRDIGTSQ